MLKEYRDHFNAAWTPARYRELLVRLDARCGTHVGFRVCETPVFLPADLLRRMEQAGREIIGQLMTGPRYRKTSEWSVPPRFRVPNESSYPLFIAVDFGIVRSPEGLLAPRVIELQGFPSLFAYQPVLCGEYMEAYELPPGLTPHPPGISGDNYESFFREAVLGTHDPAHVVLMEIDPKRQKTLPDFLLTERLCGITTVDIRDIRKRGNRLFYTRRGTQIEIRRIYNRTIPEDLERSGATTEFSLTDELDVEWAGHPNWFFRLSKFSLPFLDHPTVPRTLFLSDVTSPEDLPGSWVLKPLFSFAGNGVKVEPRAEDFAAIPPDRKKDYVLQERVDYARVIDTPHGPTKAEVRIMYIWRDHPVAMTNLVRLARGPMMGVDQNKNMEWVGSSAGFWPAGV